MKIKRVVVALLFVAIAVYAQSDDADDTNTPGPARLSAARVAVAQPRLNFSVKETFTPNGNFEVAIYQAGQWRPVGELPADKHLRSQELELSQWPDSGSVRLRVRHNGKTAAHIDSLLLAGNAPTRASDDALAKVAARDNDVVDASGMTLEVEFKPSSVPQPKPVVLELTARIEPENLDETPFHYPVDNMYKSMSSESSFYTYMPGSNQRKLTLDGDLQRENLKKPFFAEYYPVGSGHPQGTTYGWVYDDGHNLLVAIDVTADNTRDGGKDYAKVYVNAASGLKVFKVTVEETQWGKPGFTYTDRVGWQHKVYELAIPFEELGEFVGNGRGLQLAFAVYGTVGPQIDFATTDPNGVDPDNGPAGTTFNFIVNYYQDNDFAPETAQVWVDLDGDGQYNEPAAGIALPLPKIPFGGIGATLALCGLVVMIVLRRKSRLSLASSTVVLIVGLGVSLTLLLPASCSLDSGKGDAGIATVRFGVPKVATVFERYELTVSGPEMETMQSSFPGAAGSMVIEVPAGQARQLELLAVVDASDTHGVRRYRGVAVTDLAAGESKGINLSMGAVTEKINMRRVSTAPPVYSGSGEDYSMDVRIVGDPRSIDFRFYFVDSEDSSELGGPAAGTLTVTID